MKCIFPLFSDTDFGVAQTIEGEHSSKIIEVIEQSKNYISTVVNVDPAYDTVRDECRNHEPLCSFWSTLDECNKNPAYMKLHCALACQSCEQLDINVRCPMDPNAKDALAGPGDLDKLFERIVSDPYYQQYQPYYFEAKSPLAYHRGRASSSKLHHWSLGPHV